jgi:hypothetical protein
MDYPQKPSPVPFEAPKRIRRIESLMESAPPYDPEHPVYKDLEKYHPGFVVSDVIPAGLILPRPLTFR